MTWLKVQVAAVWTGLGFEHYASESGIFYKLNRSVSGFTATKISLQSSDFVPCVSRFMLFTFQ